MENAFAPGDPVLDLTSRKNTPPLNKLPNAHGGSQNSEHWYPRNEQEKVNAIVSGADKGQYYLIVGEKGCGKTSMLLRAMHLVAGEGVSMLDAHADTEIFRIRLGKALDFEYHEDYIGSLFSIRGPRDTTPLLDIERAFNKLDKVALRRRERVGKPLILIINGMHLLRDNEDGQNLLELIQQRAELWAASHLVTVILNSDDYWVYERLKLNASRLEVLPVTDLPKYRAMAALRAHRLKYFNVEPSASMLAQIYDRVGGRLAFLNRVAKSPDMLKTCEEICQTEKTWFLNQCWVLGEEMDDDVMDQQKYAVSLHLSYSTLEMTCIDKIVQSAAMVLAKALTERQKEMDEPYDPERGHILPEIPLHEARQIMTRADFIQSYDHVNIFTIDSRAMVRADSVPMQNAFREVCDRPGFDEHLEATLTRISAIESLGRTRELVAKDLWNDGAYRFTTRNSRGAVDREMSVQVVKGEEGEGTS